MSLNSSTKSLLQSKHSNKTRLRKGDEVMVMTGKSKGQTGKVDHLDTKNRLVFVSGTNISLRHTKPGGAEAEGGILEKVMPLDWSNVQLLDPKTKKPTRIGYKKEGDRKVRFAKVSGQLLDPTSKS